MLADVLISGEPGRHELQALPTIGHFHFVDDAVLDLGRMAWLAQKISIITNNLAVGWAGDYQSAKRIVSRMRAHSWGARVALDDVQRCLASCDYDDQAAVSLVGIFSHDNGFGEFGLNAPQVDLPLFNQSRIIGSGRADFLRILKQMDDFDWPHIENENIDQFWAKAIATTLGFAGLLTGEEINSFGGLRSGFGGLFEVLMSENNKFMKLDDVLYCFWAASYDTERFTLSPYTVFLKVKYHDDILIVRRADFANKKLLMNNFFAIGPMAGKDTAKRITGIQTPGLNSVHDFHYVLVRCGNIYDILSVINLFGRDSRVRFDEARGSLSFAVNDDLVRYIFDRVVQRFHEESR